jgi:hypothetical protein
MPPMTESGSPEVLYSSKAVHVKIASLFQEPSASDRRVAIVAYVGRDAASYLPHPENLLVICSPSPGGTSPAAIRALLKNKADVRFSQQLHMKVYWSSSRGCVVTSANASTSALGAHGLKEVGVYLKPGLVDIKRLIAYAAPQPVTKAAMDKLERETKQLPSRIASSKEPLVDDYLAWFVSPFRAGWKLGWLDSKDGTFAVSAKSKAKREFNTEPYALMPFRYWQIAQGDHLLEFLVNGGRITHPAWFYATFLVSISKGDKAFEPEYPWQAIQVYPLSRCPSPPFTITPAFRKAFAAAVVHFGVKNIMSSKSLVPPKPLLDDIAARMETQKTSL